MSPERRHKRPSKSEAAFRRRILSETRRSIVVGENTPIVGKEQAAVRLVVIRDMMDPKNEAHTRFSVMSEEERDLVMAQLEIEEIWLRLRLESISSAQKDELLGNKLGELRSKKPHIYDRLIKEDHALQSELTRIRDKVMPQSVGGYHTRR